MATTFTLTGVLLDQRKNVELHTYESDCGSVVRFLVINHKFRDRTYEVQSTTGVLDPQVVASLFQVFTEAMRYTEYRRDPEPGFKLEVK